MVMKVMEARKAWAWWVNLSEGQKDLIIPRLPTASKYLAAKGWMDLLTPSSREKLEKAMTQRQPDPHPGCVRDALAMPTSSARRP